LAKITISHEISRNEGKCNIHFPGLTYKEWTIFVDVDPPEHAPYIKHIKYILSQSYPHRKMTIKNTVNRFEYKTCGYQSNHIECLFDFGKSTSKRDENVYKTMSYFVDFNNDGPSTKIEFSQQLPPP